MNKKQPATKCKAGRKMRKQEKQNLKALAKSAIRTGKKLRKALKSKAKPSSPRISTISAEIKNLHKLIRDVVLS